MRRIYHPYWDWEDYKAGMWRSTGGAERRDLFARAVEFTGDAKLYGSYMQRVIREWPKACEHNLTEEGMNRLAWVGHAAVALAFGCPEDVTRQAWSVLTEQQRVDADAQAEQAVKQWLTEHARQDRQLSLFVEEARLPARHPGRGRRQVGGAVQGAQLPRDLPGHHPQRREPVYARIHAREV